MGSKWLSCAMRYDKSIDILCPFRDSPRGLSRCGTVEHSKLTLKVTKLSKSSDELCMRDDVVP